MMTDPFACLPHYRPRLHVRLVLWLMRWPMTPNAAYRAGHHKAEIAVQRMIAWRENFLGSDADTMPSGYTRDAARSDLAGLYAAEVELKNHSLPVKP